MIVQTEQVTLTVTEPFHLVYALYEGENGYSVIGYKAGGDQRDPRAFAHSDAFTAEREVAEDCLYFLRENAVFPVHIQNVVEDLFGENG